MTINSTEFTICIAVNKVGVETVRLLMPDLPVREALSRDGKIHRFFFEVMGVEDDSFELSLRNAISRANEINAPLEGIEGVATELWCIIHADAEYAGIILEASVMQFLGERRIDLYLSVYSDVEKS